MIRNKYIIFSFLYLAWAIIFAHSVIPHRHHDPNDNIKLCKLHNKNTHLLEHESIHDHDDDCSGHTCHFHVDVLIKINIDDNFISSSGNLIVNNFEVIEAKEFIYNQELITLNFSETNYLRGPPQIA